MRHYCLPIALSMILAASVAALSTDTLYQFVKSAFGTKPIPALEKWIDVLETSPKTSEQHRLAVVNNFFNENLYFISDQKLWGQNDYWATPVEFIGKSAGDCEDFTIAKYYSLQALDIEQRKLRLTYVKATIEEKGIKQEEPHMVLAYYATPASDPLILDNINKEILPASQRQDLKPIFSFNHVGLWMGEQGNASSQGLSRWQELLRRQKQQGL